MLAHVPSFGRNPRGSPDFLAYPVPKACMHVLGTRVPRRLGVARSASSPKAAQALGCSLTPGLRISFGRVTCMARAASVPGLWALGFLLLACVCGWVRVAVDRGFCLPLPVVAGVLGGCVWARFVVLSLFCRPFVVFVVGPWCRPAFGTCVVSCAFPLPPPFPVPVCGVGVRAGPGSRLCPALLGLVVGLCFLRFFVFFFFSRCWMSLSRALWSLPPSPFFRAGLLASFFFFFAACFGAPFPAGPLFLAWCCRFWLGGPPVPVWGSCLRCLLGGGFGPLVCFWRAVWWLWAVSRSPRPPLFVFFFFWGGGPPGCSSLCFPSAGACSVAGVWCGWSLATPGGGSCVLLPATPGWVSLPVVVGGPRHSWLGSAGGGGVWCVALVCWWGCGCCVVWLVPRHSWRRFLCATPRHSWLGFASAGGGRSPPLLAGVLRRWCVVCGVWRWCVGGVVAGVWCGWSLATPGGGSCVLLPATPGWVSLPLVVGGPRHSWLGSACGGVCGVWCVAVVCWWGCGLCVVWLVPRHSWRRFLCATPRHSWLGFAAAGGGRSPPLLAGVRLRRWCVVCGGGVLVGLWLVCGVVGPSPLLVCALRKWSGHIGLQPVVVCTDHQSLQSWHKEHVDTPSGPAARRARWHETFAKFDLSVVYIPGKDNTVADCLSRWAYPAGKAWMDISSHGDAEATEEAKRIIEMEKVMEQEGIKCFVVMANRTDLAKFRGARVQAIREETLEQWMVAPVELVRSVLTEDWSDDYAASEHWSKYWNAVSAPSDGDGPRA